MKFSSFIKTVASFAIIALFLLSMVSCQKEKVDTVVDTVSGFDYIIEKNNIIITGYNGNLQDIVIPNEIEGMSVTKIGNSAFKDCIFTSVVIPDSVTIIERQAFEYCTSLQNVTIPDSVTTIDEYAFNGCNSFTSMIIPDSVTIINSGIFQNCEALLNVTLPDNLTIIKDYAFNNCNSLTYVTISDKVTAIGKGAFHGCDLITSETREKILQINQRAFIFE